MGERSTEYLPLDGIVPAAVNPKLHSAEGLAESFAAHGFVEPLVMDERTGRLVAGHGRLEALQAAQASGGEPPDGVTVADGRWMVPVVRGWASSDDYAASRYLVASNALVERGGWDDRALADLLAELGGDDPGLVGTGYGPDDLDDLLARLAAREPPAVPVALTDPDEVPEPPAVPVTKRGDLWLLGEHRLLCGDATDEADHKRLLEGTVCDLVLMDPPYGVNIDYGSLVDDSAEAVRGVVQATLPLLEPHKAKLVTSGVPAHVGLPEADVGSGVGAPRWFWLGTVGIHLPEPRPCLRAGPVSGPPARTTG